MVSLKNCFENSPYGTTKHSHYFEIYEKYLSKYRNKKCTLIEVGVLNGGSLFMWRKFLGTKARIIGIDLNPEAQKWEKNGFEIYIGDQSSIQFWKKTFEKIKEFDIFIDDGGHTNLQQIKTLEAILYFENKKDSLVFFEDTHSSYMAEFGNPSLFSFINYSIKFIKDIHEKNKNKIFNISFFNSIVLYEFRKKTIKSKISFNKKFKFTNNDYRHKNILGYKLINKIVKQKGLRLFIKFIFYKVYNLKLIISYLKRF